MKNYKHHKMDLPPSLLDASWRDDDDDVSSCEDTVYQLNLKSHARSTTNSSPPTKTSNKLDTVFIATNIIFMFVLIFVCFNAPCHEGHDTSPYDISMNKPDMSTQFEDTISLLRAFEQPGMFITRSKGIWQVMSYDNDGRNIQEIKRYLTMPSLEEASVFRKEERFRRASVDKSK